MLAGGFESMVHLVEDVEVVLDVFQRAVFGKLVQERFHMLLGGGQLPLSWLRQVDEHICRSLFQF